MCEHKEINQELNELKPLKIAELINETNPYKFKIPKYQRGYRWEEEHVEALLNDIKNFYLKENKTDNEFYCLQPIVVKKDKNGVYELIDGQQRLTTIYLILREMNKNSYILKYDSKTSIEDKLKIINENDIDVDTFYIKKAWDTIEKWFSDNKNESWFNSGEKNFIHTFLNDTKIIWYEIDEADDEPIAVFKRLNKGKIPLEDAELIKALFLKTSELETNNKNTENLKDNNEQQTNDDETYKEKYIKKHQFVLASQWDNIEKELQNESFWCFLSNDTKKTNNRIEIILDIISEKHKIDKQLEEIKKAQKLQNNNSEDDDDDDESIAKKTFIEKNNEHYTFHFFEKLITNKKIEEKAKIWETVMDYFYMFQGWYNDRELYHLIGYIIETEINSLPEICSIITENKEKNGIKKLAFKNNITRESFISELKNLIKVGVIDEKDKAIEAEKYNYTKNRNLIRKILLLHNIISILNNKDSAIYNFPFHTFKNEKKRGGWDVEHISPCTSGEGKAPDDKEGMIKWYLRNIKDKNIESALNENDEGRNVLKAFNSWWWNIYKQEYGIIDDDLIENWKKTDKEATESLDKIIKNNQWKLKEADQTSFTTNYNNVIAYFNSDMNENGEKDNDDNPNRLQNTIANLVLLDAGTNRGYGNDLFPLKQATIIEYDKNTKFIPPCTKNAFLGFYGGGYHNKWEKNNAEAYKKNIDETIEEFFSDLKKDNQDG